ncbi:uncharacterized protein [Spinacia oleracea]|uniref:Uncharacterized protein n=1 Tax=Spinacia oleracea TaxID=3562 RepID=A0ABM3R1J0_SPIOL|nr:uncharacterized protein LOC110774854 [Spinacia oleracea]
MLERVWTTEYHLSVFFDVVPSWRYKYNTGYCGQCHSIVWLSNLKSRNKHSRRGSGAQPLKPLSPSQGYVQREIPYSNEELEETREQWAKYLKDNYLMDAGE